MTTFNVSEKIVESNEYTYIGYFFNPPIPMKNINEENTNKKSQLICTAYFIQVEKVNVFDYIAPAMHIMDLDSGIMYRGNTDILRFDVENDDVFKFTNNF